MAMMAGPGLTPERIWAAAMKLADSGGLERLSMRNLASTLGVKAMSLYNHVESRDAIIDKLVDQVVAEIAFTDSAADWRAAMRERAVSAHDVLLRHPWATMAIVSRVSTGPAMLAYIEGTLACLIRGGFSPVDADHVWNAVDSYLYGFTLQELRFPFKPEEYRDAASAYLPGIPEDRYPCFTSLGQQIISGAYDGLHQLEFGLEMLLDGLERTLDRRTQGFRAPSTGGLPVGAACRFPE
jgi:AcrR family transcriptional regulator